MNASTKEYKALIWNEEKSISGKRVLEKSNSIEEAMISLEEKYGKGNVFDLHNEKDANKPR